MYLTESLHGGRLRVLWLGLFSVICEEGGVSSEGNYNFLGLLFVLGLEGGEGLEGVVGGGAGR